MFAPHSWSTHQTQDLNLSLNLVFNSIGYRANAPDVLHLCSHSESLVVDTLVSSTHRDVRVHSESTFFKVIIMTIIRCVHYRYQRVPSILKEHVFNVWRIRMSSLTRAAASSPLDRSGSNTSSINRIPARFKSSRLLVKNNDSFNFIN